MLHLYTPSTNHRCSIYILRLSIWGWLEHNDYRHILRCELGMTTCMQHSLKFFLDVSKRVSWYCLISNKDRVYCLVVFSSMFSYYDSLVCKHSLAFWHVIKCWRSFTTRLYYSFEFSTLSDLLHSIGYEYN